MVPVYFYRTEVGNEPVRNWLKDLHPADRKVLGNDLQTIQSGWQTGLIGEPLVKSLGGSLFEMRTALPSRRIARVFFCIHENSIALLHGFIKKSQKTPIEELRLAKKRQKSLRDNWTGS